MSNYKNGLDEQSDLQQNPKHWKFSSCDSNNVNNSNSVQITNLMDKSIEGQSDSNRDGFTKTMYKYLFSHSKADK